ncbi:hypothetical protein [Cellulomonas fimi]|uniref:Uncharacterized protein n=1 Tax=Cellulomonas fimi TaxID=1708 RepID=A0A7Y0LX73_CELFI|nr:hypothetical protein [Cellulomonas fimi]NMR19459.1 hypothetical protein [Cellulomonas fimi]
MDAGARAVLRGVDGFDVPPVVAGHATGVRRRPDALLRHEEPADDVRFDPELLVGASCARATTPDRVRG